MVIDTSALLSLKIGNILELAIENIDFLIPNEVEDELKEISLIDDTVGNSAKIILNLVGENKIKKIEVKEKLNINLGEGEIKAYLLAKKHKIPLIIDDIRAVRKLTSQNSVKLYFSIAIIRFLVSSNFITEQESWKVLLKIRKKRTWNENIIFQLAKLIWKK